MGGCCSSKHRAEKPGKSTSRMLTPMLKSTNDSPQSSEDTTRSKQPEYSTEGPLSSAEKKYKYQLQAKVRDVISKLEQNRAPTAKLSDFEILGYLSKGAFGKVFKVQHLKSFEVFALKVQSKQDVVHRRKVDQVIMERKIQAAVDHVFIVKLHYAFKDNAALYLVLELAPCGDFLKLLGQKTCLSEEHSKIYAAQVVLVFEYLHAAQILFRDLKPENILVDQTGYLKITDFGYAKRVLGTTTSFCGTLEYLSPEQVWKKPYSNSVDWWALGVLIYEMLHGFSPFAYPGDDDRLIHRIKKDDVPWKDNVPLTPEAKALITGLLEKKVEHRLGVQANGVDDIKTHDWFSSINFLHVYQKNYPAPFVPQVQVRVKSYRNEDFPVSSTDRYRNEFADF